MQDEFLIKYFNGTASEQEKEEILAWLKSSPEHEKHLGELYDIWILTQMATAEESLEEKNAVLHNIIGAKEKNTHLPRKLGSYA